MAQTQGVQFIHRHIEQCSHLVDKRAGTPGAASVHPLIHAVVEEDDLCILSPQLNDTGGLRLQLLDHLSGGKHLLHKGQPGALSQPHSGRAGNCGRQRLVTDDFFYLLQQRFGLFPHLGKMPLIGLIQDLLPSAQHHLGGGRADVDPQNQFLCICHVVSFFMCAVGDKAHFLG